MPSPGPSDVKAADEGEGDGRAPDIAPTTAFVQSTAVFSLAASSGMRYVFMGGEDGFVRKYDFAASVSGAALLTSGQRHMMPDSVTKAGVLSAAWENEQLMFREQYKVGPDGQYMPMLSPVYSLAAQREALWVASGLESGDVRLQTTTYGEIGQPLGYLRGHTKTVSDLRLSSTESHMVSGSWDKSVVVWDMAAGVALQKQRELSSQVSCVDWRTAGAFTLEPYDANAAADDDDEDDDDDKSLFGSDGDEEMPDAADKAENDEEKETEKAGKDDANEAEKEIEKETEKEDNPEDVEMDGNSEKEENEEDEGRDEEEKDEEGKDEEGNKEESDNEEKNNEAKESRSPPRSPRSPKHTPRHSPLHTPSRSQTQSPSQSQTRSTSPSVAAAPTSSVYMSTTFNGRTELWDLRSPERVALLGGSAAPPWCVSACFSLDGGRLFAGRRNAAVEEWDLRVMSRPARTLKFPAVSGPVSCVTPFDSRTLLCASYDNIRLYDLATSRRTPFTILPGHHGAMVSRLLVDSEGRYIVSATGGRGWTESSIEASLAYEVGYVEP